MMTVSADLTAIDELCKQARLLGVAVNKRQARELLKVVDDEGLILDALLMGKRPAWLSTLLAGKK